MSLNLIPEIELQTKFNIVLGHLLYRFLTELNIFQHIFL